MFGSKKTETVTTTPTKTTSSNGTSSALNSIVHGTKIDGKIHCEHDVRIDGTLKGSLTCDSKVIIGPTGLVDGDIECENAVIEGHFTGILTVRDSLQVKESANIKGDINTDKLVVHSGAVFNVSCLMKNEMITEKSSNGIYQEVE
ncbi:MAG: polymer-forming cytoskeletal protein [Saprospiraceae bacterium]|jgi:cytoskeletal protein CcmA (bactofilin family)|nr:polymer-forming cytoskeletal protein [Saprospiraceae bacterium]MBK6480770.1 polymer-forming cytoskeletal protein [Saprospiraceae bacterium]MBK6816872.1 polymer-forming cytoskeletal protein [Saprospiraceae bacterium]MBK7371400.1 polymer-forming cytoskeletal protein [Saprospiraceae bacterium]MBK7436105.1 polymer-forming cytoskeletal protein [Saprospiraceae bacterium]